MRSAGVGARLAVACFIAVLPFEWCTDDNERGALRTVSAFHFDRNVRSSFTDCRTFSSVRPRHVSSIDGSRLRNRLATVHRTGPQRIHAAAFPRIPGGPVTLSSDIRQSRTFSRPDIHAVNRGKSGFAVPCRVVQSQPFGNSFGELI